MVDQDTHRVTVRVAEQIADEEPDAVALQVADVVAFEVADQEPDKEPDPVAAVPQHRAAGHGAVARLCGHSADTTGED